MPDLDLFAYGYYALICGFLALGVPLLETAFRRVLFGLTTGAIAAAALPFIRVALGY
jgi:hypothetical protein